MRTRYALPVAAALTLTLLGATADCGGPTGQPDDSSPVISSTQPRPRPTSAPTTSEPRVLVRDCKVRSVVDGDTMKLACEVTGNVTVRVIGIDTPETKDPRKPVQCFGQRASDEAKRRLPAGRKVRVQTDSSQDERDRYGRLLAYVSVYGADYGLDMISGGYAREYTYRKSRPYSKHARYVKAQALAKAAGRGLWGACPS